MKKICYLLLPLMLCMGLTVSASAAESFSDVSSGFWAYDVISKAAGMDIANGYDDGTFRPNEKVTYAHFSTFLAKAFYPDQCSGASGSPWYKPYTDIMEENGAFRGTLLENGFSENVNEPINRYEMALVIWNLLASQDVTMPSETTIRQTLQEIGDGSDIPQKYQTAVASCYDLGVLNGYDDGTFGGAKQMSRAEGCTVIIHMTDLMEKAPDAPDGVRDLSTKLETGFDRTLDATGSRYLLQDGSVLQIIYNASAGTNSILVETYDTAGNSTNIREIPAELSLTETFYESDDSYYLAFGQNNMEENDGLEVYRVVRYDKNWKRIGAASITGGQSYTTQPYRSTSNTAMAEENGTLILHTARLRYLTPDDGLRHQSNFTAKIRTSDMSVISTSEVFPSNHVSHSFAQYVDFDGNLPVYVDHGDAYPRGFTLTVEDAGGRARKKNFFSFSGAIGDNTTNAIPGGFGISGDNYIFAGASSPQKGNDSKKYCNAFLAVIPKGNDLNGDPTIKWLTNFSQSEKTYVGGVKLVPLNNNTFVVLWQTMKNETGQYYDSLGDFYYAVFDGKGNQIGSTQKKEGFLTPNTPPVVKGNRISWVRAGWSDDFAAKSPQTLRIYTLEIDVNPETIVQTPDSGQQVEDPNQTENPSQSENGQQTINPGQTENPSQSGNGQQTANPSQTGKPSQSGNGQQTSDSVPEGITIGQKAIVLSPNSEMIISATLKDGKAIRGNVVWTSESPELLEIKGNRLKTKANTGTGYVSASWNGYTCRSEVHIVPLNKQISLSTFSAYMDMKMWGTAKLYVFNSSDFYGKDYSVSWSVEDPSIVSLEEKVVDGYQAVRFMPKKAGETVITCRVSLPDGSNAEAYCTVHVYGSSR